MLRLIHCGSSHLAYTARDVTREFYSNRRFYPVNRSLLSMVVFLMASCAFAAEGTRLLLPRSAAGADLAAAPRPGLVKRERLVEVNPVALDRLGAGVPGGARLVLELFDDVVYQVQIDSISRVDHGYSWAGRIEGQPFSDVVLASYDGVLTGAIASPAGNYRIAYDRRGSVVEELDASFVQDEEPLPPRPAHVDTPPVRQAPPVAADDGSVIEILVVYTPIARQLAGGTAGMISAINTSIAGANRAFENSQVIERFHLAGTLEVNYTETGNRSIDLGAVRNTDDGAMDEVHTLRDSLAADLVTLVVEPQLSTNTCGGTANYPDMDDPRGHYAFAVIERRCMGGLAVFAHETGHNQGLAHARSDYNPEPVGGYNYGYKDPSNAFRTVMAYNCPVSCPTIFNFSNPSVLYNGKVTGIAETSAQAANNAKVLNENRVFVANFRQTSTRYQAVWHDWFAVDTLETPMVGDFDGDRKTDIITFTRQNPNAVGDVYVALSDGTKFGANTKWHDWFAITTDETVVIGDYDGDGKDDIATWLGKTSRQVYVARSLGTGMTKEAVWVDSIGRDPSDVLLSGDANGDKKDDLICFARGDGQVYVALSDGTKFGAPQVWHTWFAVSTYERPHVADVTGDGKADIVTFASDSPTAQGDVYVAVSDGTRFVDQAGQANSSTKWHDWFAVAQNQRIRIGDADGDRKDDFFTFMPAPMAQAYFVQSLGSGMGENRLWYEDVAPVATDVPFVGDVHGDGRADIIIFAQGEGKVYVSPMN